VRQTVDELGLPPSAVEYAAYTGKAASVLAKKTGLKASTVHRLIYSPGRDRLREIRQRVRHLEKLPALEQTPGVIAELKQLRQEAQQLRRGSLTFVLVEDSIVKQAPLVVLDEISMINSRIGRDLESFGTRLLVIGDPAQLPPVEGAGYFTAREPDFLLTKIERNGGGVVEAATEVRETGRAPRDDIEDDAGVFRRREKGELPWEEFLAADQVLVGTNATRRRLNRGFRKHLERDGSWLPVAGDKLICCANQYDLGLLNGTCWTASSDATEVSASHEEFVINLRGDDGEELEHVPVSTQRFQSYLKRDVLVYPRGDEGIAEFDFGYAMTVHKSQGSEWNDVIVCDDWPGSDRKRWLYTALTRAVERVTLVG
jgi:exodeoxyribonuclease-5